MTLTTRQRIEMLMAHDNFDAYLTSAALGIDVNVIENTLNDPNFVPSDSVVSVASGPHITHKFPFAYNTPGLRTGATAAFTDGYTPAIGDLLIDAWFEIDTAWDGTTPRLDFGLFVGTVAGLYVNAIAPLDLSGRADNEASGTGLLQGFLPALSVVGSIASIPRLIQVSGGGPGLEQIFPSTISSAYRATPLKLTTVNPVKVVVSQNGASNGADPGSTQGSAIFYMTTARVS